MPLVCCRSLPPTVHATKFDQDYRRHIRIDTQVGSFSCPSLLRYYGNAKSWAQGKWVHAHVLKAGIENDHLIGRLLFEMYIKCDSLEDARSVFEKIHNGSVYRWTTMIAAYDRHGQHKEALLLFKLMVQEGIALNNFIFSVMLDVCSNMENLHVGKVIHANILCVKIHPDVVLETGIVKMYGKCNSLEDAGRVFENMCKHDVISWSAMIAAYVENGYGKKVLELFHQMHVVGIKPTSITYISIINAFDSKEELSRAKQMHAHILRSKIGSSIVLETALVNMYGKCGSTDDARHVFGRMHEHNVISWTTMLAAYGQNGRSREAIQFFYELQEKGREANEITFVTILDVCIKLASLVEGKRVHAQILGAIPNPDTFAGNVLIDMYGKCGSLVEACKVFDRLSCQDVVSWSSIIAAYARIGHGKEALKLFHEMKRDCIEPDKVSFIHILEVCDKYEQFPLGKQLHSCIMSSSFELDDVVRATLITMYGKTGSPRDAQIVFDRMVQNNVVSWTTVISAYAANGYGEEALCLFEQMQTDNVILDPIMFANMFDVCASIPYLEKGKSIHALVLCSGSKPDLESLINMYGECCCLEDALALFDAMDERNLEMWTTVLTIYIHNGCNKGALCLFQQMQLEGLRPDEFVYASMLDACACLAALGKGKWAHACIAASGFDSDPIVANAIVNLYGKCGRLEDAYVAFNQILGSRDLVSWSAMISICAHNGKTRLALHLCQQMQLEGTKPNEVTFVGLLYACSHAGLIDEACQIFLPMYWEHDMIPTSHHYSSIIDMLGRAGQLDEAADFINCMYFQPNAELWMTLLGASSIHNEPEQGKYAAEQTFTLDSDNSAAYILLSNIYAAV